MDHEMAERIAAAFNDADRRMKRWDQMSAGYREILTRRWLQRIEAIRRAGFDVVRKEDQR